MAAHGASGIEVEADITNGAKVERSVNKVRDAMGQIDILVNNAGVILEKPFLDTSEEDWDYVLDTDLKAVFLCSRFFFQAEDGIRYWSVTGVQTCALPI